MGQITGSIYGTIFFIFSEDCYHSTDMKRL